jgi:nucleoside-diphosphate-sugar epimerase
MKILVTGANGLLGHHVVMQLLERNEEVSVIVRSKNAVFFDVSKVNLTLGDFTSHQTLKNAAQGCDAIIHIAAVTATNLLNYSDYDSVNVKGSATIVDVADELNINKIVFISTTNTVGYGIKEIHSDEKSPIQYPFTKSFYAQSKVEAEKIFEAASKKPNRHVIIIHPGFMIGAYDTKPSSGKLMIMGYRKQWMASPNGGKNFVPATDVATAICNALTMGKNGDHYLAAGINYSFREYYELQSRVGEYHQNLILLPDMVLELAAKVGDLLQLAGVKTDVCSRNFNQLTIQEYYSNTKICKELGMPQTPLAEAISEAMEWFRKNGYL